MHSSFKAKRQLSISPCHTLKTWTQDNRRRISQSQGYRNISPIGPLHSTGLHSAIKYDSLDPSFIGCSYLTVTSAVSDIQYVIDMCLSSLQAGHKIAIVIAIVISKSKGYHNFSMAHQWWPNRFWKA